MYGTLGVVLSILTICYIFLNYGLQQIISKSIALYPESTKSILNKGLLGQIAVASVISLLLFIFSWPLSILLNDEKLFLPLKICSAIVLAHGIYYIYTGALNGLKKFFLDNLVQTIYAVIRPIAALLLVILGLGIPGVMYGTLIASIIATVVGMAFLIDVPNAPNDLRLKNMLRSAISNVVIFGAITVIMNVDLLFVKRLIGGSEATGLYTAASVFSKLPYWFLFSFGTIAFPLIAASYGQRNIPQCRIYFSQVLRYSTLIFLPFIIIIAGTAEDLLVLFYSMEYQLAGSPLRILIFGLWFVGLSSVMANLMIAVGQEDLMAGMTVVTILVNIVLNLFLIPRLGLNGASVATSLSGLFLTLLSGAYLIKKIGIDFNQLTIVRLTLLSVVLYFAAQMPAFDDIFLLLKYLILYTGFAICLLLTGEIGAEDWMVLKRLMERRR